MPHDRSNHKHDLDRKQQLTDTELEELERAGHAADQQQLEERRSYEERKKDLDSHIRGIVIFATKKDLDTPIGRLLSTGKKRYSDDAAALDVWMERYIKVFPNSSRSQFAFQRIKRDLEDISKKIHEDCMTAWYGELTGFEVKKEFEPSIEGESNWWRIELRTRINKLNLLAETYFNSRTISSQPNSKAIEHADRYFEGLKETLTNEATFPGLITESGRRWWLKMDRELRVLEHLFAKRDTSSIFVEESVPALFRLDHIRSRMLLSAEPSRVIGQGRSTQQSLSKFSPIARSARV